MTRLFLLDAIKGLAIIGMIVYHFLFDLDYFDYLQVNFQSIEMIVFARIVQVLFISLVGVSTYIVYLNAQNYRTFIRKQFKRFVIIGLNALIISVVTWFIAREQYISFGILHLLSFSVFILTFLAKLHPILLSLLSIFIFVIWGVTDHIIINNGFAWLGYRTIDFASLDYFPVVPWLSVSILGFVFGPLIVKLAGKLNKLNFPVTLLFLGKKSLFVYMTHQPILIFFIYIFSKLV